MCIKPSEVKPPSFELARTTSVFGAAGALVSIVFDLSILSLLKRLIARLSAPRLCLFGCDVYKLHIGWRLHLEIVSPFASFENCQRMGRWAIASRVYIH